MTLPSVEFLLCSAQNSQVSIASDSRDSARIVMIVQYSTKLVVPSICRCWSRYIIQCLVVTMNPFVMRSPAHTSPYQPIPAHISPVHDIEDIVTLTDHCSQYTLHNLDHQEVRGRRIVLQKCFCSFALLLKTTRYY